MPISFTPMTPELVNKECDHIISSGDSYNAISSYTNANTDPFYTADANVRTTFRLSHYVVNQMIAGSSMSNVYPFFGLSQSDAKDICDISKVYNLDTQELERIKSIVDNGCTNILVGGDYIAYLVENLTKEKFEQNILSYTVKKLDDVPGRKVAFKSLLSLTFNPTNIPDGYKSFHIAEGMYVFGMPATDASKEVLDNFMNQLRITLFESGRSTVSKMLALHRRSIDRIKEFLLGMLVKDIVILPKIMRPSREGVFLQHDPLDILYKEVFEANRTMTTLSLTSQNISTYINYYRTLYQKVNYLIYKHDPKKKMRKSILEKLASKKGQLRGSNLGKRLDYSGRSVIVINPFMSMRNIKIPKRTLPKLYKYHILQKAKEQTDKNIPGMTPLDIVGSNQNNIKGKMLTAIETGQLLKKVPVVIGRQPTLHKGSTCSFYAEPTDGNAFELSPLVVPMFNADFDGDTMWDTVPLSPEAIEEAKTILLGVNNLFWAKDGKAAIAPRQEIIYGLNACTKDWGYEKGITVKESLTPAEAYKRVIRNQLRVYDKVNTSIGTTTVGKLAFRHCVEHVYDDSAPKPVLRNICVCPVCLSTKVSKSDTVCYCDKHSNVQMIPAHSFYSVHCSNCGSEYDTSKLGGAFVSKEERNSRVQKAIERIMMTLPDRINTLELCRALAEIEADKDCYIRLCKILAKADTLDLSTVAVKQSVDGASADELASITAHNKVCRCIDALIKLPESLQKKYMSDIVPENFGVKTAKFINVPGTFIFNACGNGFNCTLDLSNSEDADLCLELLQSANATRDELSSQYSVVTNMPACTACSTITKSNIATYISKLLVAGKDIFVDAIDKMVVLGFKVAKFYAPSLNVLSDINFDEEFKSFHSDVENIVQMYEYGFIEDEMYSDEYSKGLEVLQKNVKQNIEERLGENNGFLKMVQSGARGSIDNLIQIYGYKGRVTKSSTEAFNAVIESSYTKQLSPFEHFMAAYGARRGIMDRSLETANTGYISRQLWHATQAMIVTDCDDCGTHDGIVIKRHSLNLFNLPKDPVERRKEENKLLMLFITGRYDLNGNLITKKRAKEMVESGEEIAIRSPITCKNPCCVKCYGRDMSTHDIVVKGTPIGIIAAQGIGETTAQLTMRTFQGGGVAKKGGGIGSAFDAMQSYVNITDADKLGNYEPTAWVSGNVMSKPATNGMVEVTIAPNGSTFEEASKMGRVFLHEDVVLKASVEVGEGLYVDAGDQYLPEIWTNANINEAAIYLALKLFKLYRSECEINLKHFEVLAASMMRAVVLDGTGSKLLTGCCYSYKELLENGWTPSSDIPLYWKLFKINDIPLKSPHAVANIDFEEMSEGLFSAMVYGRVENFADPIESIVFGQRPKVGKEINPHYIEERTNFKVSEDII